MADALLSATPGFPADPLTAMPPRKPESIRRTSRLLTTWPEGVSGPLRVDGIARDVRTPTTNTTTDAAQILDQASITVTFSDDRVVRSVKTSPTNASVDHLIGSGPGRGFRRALNAAFPEPHGGSPLAYFLAEDLTTAPLLSAFALSQRPETHRRFLEVSATPSADMEGVCTGYRNGGVAIGLHRAGVLSSQNVASVAPTHNDDPTAAWFPLQAPPHVAMCRRRRIDVHRDGEVVLVDAWFRDHSWDADGQELIVHEYQLWAELGAPHSSHHSEMELRKVSALPRVIPYPDCPGAAANVSRLAGESVASLRPRVLEELRGVDSCTHLNDMARALAELPTLVDHLNAGPELQQR